MACASQSKGIIIKIIIVTIVAVVVDVVVWNIRRVLVGVMEANCSNIIFVVFTIVDNEKKMKGDNRKFSSTVFVEISTIIIESISAKF